MSFSMIFWIIDLAETTDVFRIYFDDQDLGVWDSYLYNYASGSYQTNYCGNTNPDFPNLNVQGKIPHSASQITLKVVLLTTSSAFSFGFRNVSLLFSTNSPVTATSSCKFISPTASQTTCECPGGYYNPLGSTSCLLCNSACASCSGSTPNDCTSCKPGYSFDGQKCFQCNAACSQCSGTAANQCVRCANSAYFLQVDGTCSSTCSSPYVANTKGIYKTCDYPCGATGFLNDNGTCSTSCPYPYAQETVSGIQYCHALCGTTQYLFKNLTCKSNCPSTFIAGTDGYIKLCTTACDSTEYYNPNSSCTTSCPSPYVSSTSSGINYCSSPCNGTSSLYKNSSCLEICPFPYIQSSDGFINYCNPPCSTGQFLNENNTCTSGCLSPYIQMNIYGVLYCKKPCDVNYLYQNGSCGASCVSPYTQGTDGYVKYCYSPCPSTAPFLNENNNCTNSCLSPYLQSTSNGILYCLKPCGTNFLYQNGTCGAGCVSPYTQGTDGYVKYCYSPCSSGQFLNDNLNCTSSCPSPYVQSTSNGVQYCTTPCGATNFLYQNSTCGASCVSPYTQGTDGYVKYCYSPCPSTALFLNENSTCTSACPSPYLQVSFDGVQYCKTPCGTANFLYQNNTCGAACVSPYTQTTDGFVKYCNSPCASGEFLNDNSNCTSSCPTPYIQASSNGVQYCKTPCGTTVFFYQNNTCGATCVSPYTQGTDGYVKYCYSPCDSSSFIYPNSSCLSTCSSPFKQRSTGGFQYCDKPCADPLFLYPNGSCLSDCNYTDFTDLNQIKYCQYPCSSSQYYYENGACKTSCPSPYTSEIVDAYLKLCNSPCDDNLFYSEYQQKCITNCPSQYSTKSVGSLEICQDSESSAVTLSGVASAISSISDVVSKAGDILRPNDRNSIFMVSLAKLVKYVIYIDISLPEKVKAAFQSSNSSFFSFPTMFSFSMPSEWSNAFPTYPLPDVFANNGVSSCYLVNQWTSLSSYLIIFMLGVISGLLENVLKRSSKKKLTMVLTRIRIITQWAFVLFLLFNSFDDFTFYAILQIYSLQFHSDLDYLSFAVCLTVTFITFGVLIKTVLIDYKAQKVKNQIISSKAVAPGLTFYQKWKTFQVLYAGFKPKTFLMQAYLVTSTARIIICYLIIGFLYKYPVLQGCLLVLLSMSVFSFLLYKKPVKDPVNFFVLITYETLVFLVNICVLIIAILDSEDAGGDSSQNQMHDLVSNILLILNGIINICSNAFMYVYLMWNAWGFYKINKKTPGFESKLVWLNLFVTPYQNPGMDFDEFSFNPSSPEKSSSLTGIKIYPLKFEGKDQNSLEISGKNSSMASLQKLNRRFSNFSQNTNEPNDASGVTANLTNREPNRRTPKFKGKSFGIDSHDTLDLDSDYQELGFPSPNSPDTLSLDTSKSFAQAIMFPKNPFDSSSPPRRPRDLRRSGRPGLLRKTQIPIVTSKPEPFVIVEEPSPALQRNPSETRRRRRTANPQENFLEKEKFLDYSKPVYARKHVEEAERGDFPPKVGKVLDYNEIVYARKNVAEAAAAKGWTKPLRIMNADLMNIEDILGKVSDSPSQADRGGIEPEKTIYENLLVKAHYIDMKNLMKNDNEKKNGKDDSKRLSMSYREMSGATSKRELKRYDEDKDEKEDWEKNPEEFVRTKKKTRSMIKTLFFPRGNNE